MQTLEQNLAKIERIRALKNQMNQSTKELPIVPDNVLDAVSDSLSVFDEQPLISPTYRETLQMEYEPDPDNYLEFEIDENLNVTVYQIINGYDMECPVGFPYDPRTINMMLWMFLNAKR